MTGNRVEVPPFDPQVSMRQPHGRPGVLLWPAHRLTQESELMRLQAVHMRFAEKRLQQRIRQHTDVKLIHGCEHGRRTSDPFIQSHGHLLSLPLRTLGTTRTAHCL
jgi:hypothetical protein